MVASMVAAVVFTIAATLALIALFWLAIVIYYGPEEFYPEEAPEKEFNAEVEQQRLQQELQREGKIPLIKLGDTENSKELAANFGIARNRFMVKEDHKRENLALGCEWVCDNRPIIFAALFQTPFSLALALPIALLGNLVLPTFFSAFLGAAIGSVIATIVIGVKCHISVGENERAGVTRFGKQQRYLGTGLQFYLKWFGEKVTDLTLKHSIWGPGNEEGKNRIYGTMGDNAINPNPGVFHIPFEGRWPTVVYSTVEMCLMWSSEQAWYDAQNRYDSPIEIGEQIAGVFHSTLTKAIREVGEPVNGNENKQDKPEKQKGDQRGEAEFKIMSLMNKVPEIAAQLLIQLNDMTLNRELAGILAVNVKLAIVAGEELQSLLQQLDRARLLIEESTSRGKARVKYQEPLFEFIKARGGDATLMATYEQIDALRSFAPREGESAEPLSAAARAFTAKFAQEAAEAARQASGSTSPNTGTTPKTGP